MIWIGALFCRFVVPKVLFNRRILCNVFQNVLKGLYISRLSPSSTTGQIDSHTEIFTSSKEWPTLTNLAKFQDEEQRLQTLNFVTTVCCATTKRGKRIFLCCKRPANQITPKCYAGNPFAISANQIAKIDTSATAGSTG
jgi:hypothetical protein